MHVSTKTLFFVLAGYKREGGRAAGRFSSPCIQFTAQQASLTSRSNLRRCPQVKPPEDHAGRSRGCGKRRIPSVLRGPDGRSAPSARDVMAAGRSLGLARPSFQFPHGAPSGRLALAACVFDLARKLSSSASRQTTCVRSHLWRHQFERGSAAGEVLRTGSVGHVGPVRIGLSTHPPVQSLVARSTSRLAPSQDGAGCIVRRTQVHVDIPCSGICGRLDPGRFGRHALSR